MDVPVGPLVRVLVRGIWYNRFRETDQQGELDAEALIFSHPRRRLGAGCWQALALASLRLSFRASIFRSLPVALTRFPVGVGRRGQSGS